MFIYCPPFMFMTKIIRGADAQASAPLLCVVCKMKGFMFMNLLYFLHSLWL